MLVYFLIGYNIAHGYYLNENPQTSNQFPSGALLNTNSEDKTQVVGDQSFVSLQREPVHHETGEDVSSITSLGEKMAQHQPVSGQEDQFLEAPAVQKYGNLSSGYQHPFGVLVKEHAPKNTVEGISFPTITDFRRFIETMKSSFLTPGSDLSRHFQTARETMKNQFTSGAQNINGESSMSNSVKEGSAHDDDSKNEVWSETDANYQKPSESLSFLDPVDSTGSVISPSRFDNQDSSIYSRQNLAATEHVSNNYGRLTNYGEENHDILTRAPDVQNENAQSKSYEPPEQNHPGSIYGEYYSPPVSPPNSPFQDQSYYSIKKSRIKSLTSDENIHQPKYSFQSGVSLTGYQQPSAGFELGNDFQREELHRETESELRSLQKPLNSYGKSIYVTAPRVQFYIPDNISKHKRPDQSVHTYQPTVDKDINSDPSDHLPVSTGPASSSSDLSPQSSSSSHMSVEASSSHDPRHQEFNRKPIRSNLFIMKPSSSSHDSSRHDGHLGNQRVDVSRPSTLTAQAEDEEKSDLSKQNLGFAIQEPKQMNDYSLIPPSPGLDSTQSAISSPFSDDNASFDYPTNLPSTSEPKKASSRLLGNEVMSKTFEIKNMISDRFPHSARKLQDLFPTKQKQGITLNAGSLGSTRAGLLHTFAQSTKVQRRPASGNRDFYRPHKPLSTSKLSGSTLNGVFWREGSNTKRLPPQTGPKTSPPFVSAYVTQSRNGYARHKVFLSKTSYTPYRHFEGKAAKDQWKPDPRRSEAPLFEMGKDQHLRKIKWYGKKPSNVLLLNITAVLITRLS